MNVNVKRFLKKSKGAFTNYGTNFVNPEWTGRECLIQYNAFVNQSDIFNTYRLEVFYDKTTYEPVIMLSIFNKFTLKKKKVYFDYRYLDIEQTKIINKMIQLLMANYKEDIQKLLKKGILFHDNDYIKTEHEKTIIGEYSIMKLKSLNDFYLITRKNVLGKYVNVDLTISEEMEQFKKTIDENCLYSYRILY